MKHKRGLLEILVGDVLDEPVDILICSGNVQLNLSGGVGGALLLRGGEGVQQELHEFIRKSGQKHVDPGTVVVTGPGPLAVKNIVHVVAIDAFYESNPTLLRQAICNAFDAARGLQARSLAMPALATGYGRVPMGMFLEALAVEWPRYQDAFVSLRLVLISKEHAETARAMLRRTAQ